MGGPFVILLIVAAVIALAALNAWQAAKRREAMQALAARLKLTFSPDRNYELPARYAFLDRLAKGSNRYAENLLAGCLDTHEVCAFDYHYETYSTDSKGRRHTHHHHFSCFVLKLPKTFPELLIAPESFFDKVSQAFGFDDIDFESHEFSRRFCVRSKDKKFAYDVCHARMIEYLLGNRDLSLELEQNALTLGFNGRLIPDQIAHNLERLVAIRNLLPAYLLEGVPS